MIEKAKLLESLGKCLALEEESIPLYNLPTNEPEFFAGFKPESQAHARDLLCRLARESEFQAQTFRDLIKAVEGADQDGF